MDRVVCRWGYMLMADPAAALAETRRVLRDDGTLGFVVWQTPDRNMWAAVPAMTLIQRGHMPPPEPGAPGIFAMGERDRIVELVTGAGFPEPRIEELTFEWNYGANDVWDTINRLAGPIAAVIKQLSAQEQQEVREAIEAGFEEYRDGDNLKVPAACWGVVRAERKAPGVAFAACSRRRARQLGQRRVRLHRPGRPGVRLHERAREPRRRVRRLRGAAGGRPPRAQRRGSRRRLKIAPGAAPLEETVTQFVPGELIEYRITKGSPLRDHVGIMRFSPLPGGGTHLSYRIRIASRVPGLSPLVTAVLTRNVTKGLASVESAA